jgi:carbon-monoxide dehydrogenase medium subunit
MRNFNYFAPKDLHEVQNLLAKYPEKSFLMAGGTDLMVLMRLRQVIPKYVIDLKGAGLRYIKAMEKGLAIGATTTLHDIETSLLVRERCRILAATCSDMASYSIRHLGTLGGNLCNASPSADTVPPLIVLGAKVKMSGPKGERLIPVETMFTGPGETVLKPGEVLTEIQIPDLPPSGKAAYLKFKRNNGMDLAVVGVAVCLIMDGTGKVCQEARMALGAVAPIPVRAPAAEKVLQGKVLNEDLIKEAGIKAKEAAKPISDVRSSSDFRVALVEVLTRDTLKQLTA